MDIYLSPKSTLFVVSTTAIILLDVPIFNVFMLQPHHHSPNKAGLYEGSFFWGRRGLGGWVNLVPLHILGRNNLVI